jgi:alpha-1,2-mannosyltransferase
MWNLSRRIFQAILLLIWASTLIYLICLSTFTFLLLNLFLTIFVCSLLLTLTGWCIAFIPILKFIFIPWYRQQCRSWTTNDRKSLLSVAFFHPYCNDEGGAERVLWTAIETIIKKYKNDIQIIIYTGDTDVTSEEILQRVKQRFDIDMEIHQSSITFIYLQSRLLVEAKYYKIFTLLGQSIGSIILGLEALIRFIPDIYIDSTGYAFTYPCFYYLASVPIISYVHYPTINLDRIKQVNKQCTVYNNPQVIAESSWINQMSLIYYGIFAYVYGWCGRCSQIVYCNSLWTKGHIESIWGLRSIHLVYPPCDVKQFLELPLINEDEQTIKTIVSVGQFRAEQNHEVQIRAFHELLQRYI